MSTNKMSEVKTQPLRHKIMFLVDILMIALVILDLSLIAFDSLFEVKIFREQFLRFLAPDFTQWYGDHISQNFLFYESTVFFSIFVSELLVRWFLAVVYKTYDKWFFYPIYHWYDVLGCIPTSSFRILRFMRIFVLIYRLHRWKVINLNDYTLYRQMIHYYNIIVEEISDRVAVNLLEEAKSEIKRGEPIGNIIVSDVIKPHQQEITDWASTHIRRGLNRHYNQHRKDIQNYLQQIIKETVEANKEVSNLERIPVLGSVITESLNKAVADITFGVIDRITADLASSEKSVIIESIVSAVLEIFFAAGQDSNAKQKQLTNQLVSDAVDLIISRVQEKKWKLAEKEQQEDLKDVFY